MFLAITRGGERPRVLDQKQEERRRRRNEAWELDEERLGSIGRKKKGTENWDARRAKKQKRQEEDHD